MRHKKAVSSPSVMQQGVWAPLDTSAVWPPWSKEGLGPTNPPPPHPPNLVSRPILLSWDEGQSDGQGWVG